MVKETKREPDTGDDGDWQALQVMSREQKERLKYKGLQTYIFSQNIHRAEAANSHLSGGAKRVYVTLQKDKHLFKIKLLFLPDMQANQAHHRQKKTFMLSAVSSLGVVKHHRALNCYGIFCIGCQLLFAGDLKSYVKHRKIWTTISRP